MYQTIYYGIIFLLPNVRLQYMNLHNTKVKCFLPNLQFSDSKFAQKNLLTSCNDIYVAMHKNVPNYMI